MTTRHPGHHGARPREHSPLAPLLLNTEQVSALTGLAVSTLQNWRTEGAGPRYVKIGRAVRYHRRDVEEWVTALPVTEAVAA